MTQLRAPAPAPPEVRPRVLFVAWTRTSGRSHEIAAALGGRAVCVMPTRFGAGRLVLVRYAYSAAATLRALARYRPTSVIVTNPPVVSALVVRAWTALAGGGYLLDSHPSSFGAKDHRLSQRLLPVHRWLARGAVTTMVTAQVWVDVLASWGAAGTVVHEAPPLWTTSPLTGPSRGRVLFPGVFAGDEPIDVVLEVARRRPQLQIRVTGDLRRCPERVREQLPPNVRLLGYLPTPAFAAEVDAADVVLVLTSEPTSVARAGYEAVYSRRPLVVSDWPVAREAFPCAVHAPNEAQALAEALDRAQTSNARAAGALDAALAAAEERWSQQLDALRRATSRPAGRAAGGGRR